jgi:hypothetical protein
LGRPLGTWGDIIAIIFFKEIKEIKEHKIRTEIVSNIFSTLEGIFISS